MKASAMEALSSLGKVILFVDFFSVARLHCYYQLRCVALFNFLFVIEQTRRSISFTVNHSPQE
jgi:hypothetical protein